MPKVTVLLAVYNGERYLREAIDSILGQTFQDFEFLIINDGSTDSTREIILSYHDPRIRLVDNEDNIGQTRSLNRGLALAAGQFVARQDADDISEPERLASQVAFLEIHPEVVLLGTWYRKIDSQGTVIGDRELPCDNTQIRWCLLFFCPFVHTSVMLRTSAVLASVGPYNNALAYSQDYELWRRIARHRPVANLGQHLVKLRIHPQSMTTTYGERVQEGQQMRIAQMRQLLGWDNRNEAREAKQFTDMASLLFGSHTDLQTHEASSAAEEILKLSLAFRHLYAMSHHDYTTHRAKLRAHLSRRLMDLADHRLQQNDYTAALQLIPAALRLHWPVLLAKSSVRLSAQLFTGSHLGRVMKGIAGKRGN